MSSFPTSTTSADRALQRLQRITAAASFRQRNSSTPLVTTGLPATAFHGRTGMFGPVAATHTKGELDAAETMLELYKPVVFGTQQPEAARATNINVDMGDDDFKVAVGEGPQILVGSNAEAQNSPQESRGAAIDVIMGSTGPDETADDQAGGSDKHNTGGQPTGNPQPGAGTIAFPGFTTQATTLGPCTTARRDAPF
jgi:hypothetical protein